MGMLNLKHQAELDQSRKALTENLPPMIRGLYDGLLKEGFSEIQAMELTKMFVAGMAGARVG